MKKLLTIIGLVFISAANLAISDCGPHNGPYEQLADGIDTTKITHLQNPIRINISVNVREYNMTTREFIPVNGATVHFFNNDTTIYSDANGYTNTTFYTDTLPYKYGYSINKTGFKLHSGYNWDTVNTLNRTITLDN